MNTKTCLALAIPLMLVIAYVITKIIRKNEEAE